MKEKEHFLEISELNLTELTKLIDIAYKLQMEKYVDKLSVIMTDILIKSKNINILSNNLKSIYNSIKE